MTSAPETNNTAYEQITYTKTQLEKMKKDELLNLADELGVEDLTDKTLKADIITAVLEAGK